VLEVAAGRVPLARPNTGGEAVYLRMLGGDFRIYLRPPPRVFLPGCPCPLLASGLGGRVPCQLLLEGGALFRQLSRAAFLTTEEPAQSARLPGLEFLPNRRRQRVRVSAQVQRC
jgi:hypothetical protein